MRDILLNLRNMIICLLMHCFKSRRLRDMVKGVSYGEWDFCVLSHRDAFCFVHIIDVGFA